MPKKYIALIIALFTLAGVAADPGQGIRLNVKFDSLREYSSEKNLESIIDSLRLLSAQALTKGEYETVLMCAHSLDTIGNETKDNGVLLAANIMLIHYSLGTADYSLIDHYFERGLELGEKTGNRRAIASIYSDMGIYAVNVEMDYYKGLYYFTEGLKLAEELQDERMTMVIMHNMALTYNLRNDPAGREYAHKVYDYAHRENDQYHVFMASYLLAIMYEQLKDYDTALKYIEETVSMVSEYRDHIGVYDLYATILLAMGRESEAQKYYVKALEYADEGEVISVVNAHLNYGRYLMGKKNYAAAIDVLRTGINISVEKNNPVYRYKLYESISEANKQLGDYEKALDYYTLFHHEADSVFNVERERSINQLRIQYESEKKEREIQEARLEILGGEKKLQISILVIVVVCIAFGATYVLYQRKKKNYLVIVKQSQEALNKERWYQQRIGELSGTGDRTNAAGSNSGNKYSVSSLTDEKSDRLFSDLDNLMKREQLYREKDLTRETVANKLSTNRTYLSQIINEHTGLSFNYYVHSFRIDEAVRLLSDPDNDIPLKALADDLGFNGLSTFYKLFQATMGMPPSKYREKIKEKRDANK